VTTRQLEDVLGAEVAARPPLLVVDLSRLTFVDSWALHVILAARRDLGAAGRALALAVPAGAVRMVLELTGAGRAGAGTRQRARRGQAVAAPGPALPGAGSGRLQ